VDQQSQLMAAGSRPPRLFHPSNNAEANHIPRTFWTFFSKLITCWAPKCCMRQLGAKFEDKLVRQAWREKVALCAIVLFISAIVGFSTLALSPLMCSGTVG
jgi:chitin synthase